MVTKFKLRPKKLAKIEPRANPMRQGISYRRWLNKSFVGCALSKADSECNFKNGTKRDSSIVSKINFQIFRVLEVEISLQAYFCGTDKKCTKHNSEWALQVLHFNSVL